MPLNLLKKYNEKLELLYLEERDNTRSFRSVFDRDISAHPNLQFQGIPIKPTTAEGEDAMDRLFRHLTTIIIDKEIKKREFDLDRSIRLHWIKYHLESIGLPKVLVFTVEEERRVYLLDKTERYVIVLEPLRKEKAFFLLTAYYLLPGNYKAVLTKYEKRGKDGICY